MSAKIELCTLEESLIIVGRPSRSTFYEGISAGRFPQPVKIGPHAVRWPKHELEACVAAMLAARKVRK